MRYLIIKTSAFGDVVHAFPVLHYLRQRDPSAVIDWVVEKKIAPLVRAHPNVDRVIEINAKEWKKKLHHGTSWQEATSFVQELRKEHYDAVFDLQSNIKSALVAFFVKADAKVGFGWKTAHERINCCFMNRRFDPPQGQNVRQDYLFLVQKFFNDFSLSPSEEVLLRLTSEEQEIFEKYRTQFGRNAWMICSGSQWPNKQLLQAQLSKFLQQSKYVFQPNFIFLSGSNEEKKVVETLMGEFPGSLSVDRLPLPVVQSLMRHVALVVSMDSLPLHLAATANTATFSFFGPSLSSKLRPMGDSHFSFQGKCPINYTFEKRCPILRTCPTGACLRAADPDLLFSTFTDWWHKRALQKIG